MESEGWHVVEADTLKQGLIDAGTRKPDLVILDLGLPDGNGIDFIHDFRGWSSVPVIVLSARVDETDKIAALDAGADDYLTKPFGVGELLARVRATLRRQAPPRPTATACSASATSRSTRPTGSCARRAPCPPDADRVPAAHAADRQRRQGADASASAARSLGAELRREQSLRPHLRGHTCGRSSRPIPRSRATS